MRDRKVIKFANLVSERLDQAVVEKRVWNLHGLVIVLNGQIVIERYFEGEDRVRRPGGILSLGRVAFGSNTLHDLHSCSKSLVSLLYGIALQQGKVPPPDASLFSEFPEYLDLATEDGRDRLTIHHVLTMSMGTEWDETSFAYTDPRNSETAMDRAPDRYRYILERPVIHAPGAYWTYCGGAATLLARIITKNTGKTLHTYAREALFEPLGLGSTEWVNNADGEPCASSGARMTTRDLARIGLMMADNGEMDGRLIIPTSWVARCVAPAISADEIGPWVAAEQRVGFSPRHRGERGRAAAGVRRGRRCRAG